MLPNRNKTDQKSYSFSRDCLCKCELALSSIQSAPLSALARSEWTVTDDCGESFSYQ